MTESEMVSVVLPAYNEEATIDEAVTRTLEALEALRPRGSFEVIIAEDGCTDRTPEIAAQLAESDDRVNHYHSSERLGRGRALSEAFRTAEGNILVYFDTDLSTDLTHLEELIGSVQAGIADIAIGSRRIPGSAIDRPASREIPSSVYNFLVRTLLGSRIHDHQCGFKAFNRDVLLALLDGVKDDHWFWDTEILVQAQRAGYEIKEFPVHWTHKGDTSVDFVRDVLGMGSQIVRTWWQLAVRPRITPSRSIAAGVILTVLAAALMTQYLDFGAVVRRMAAANGMLLILAALVYLTSWPLRGSRYRGILREIGFHERLGFLIGAIFISQTGNLVFPARAGDAVRAYVLKTRRAVPYASGFASLAIERVFDLLTISVLAGVIFLGFLVSGGSSIQSIQANIIGTEFRSGRIAIQVAATVGIAAIGAIIIILVSARSDRNRVREYVTLISTDSYAKYVASIIERFIRDVQTVAASPTAFTRLGAASILIWSIDVVTAAIVLAAFNPGLNLDLLVAVCFFAVSVGNLAKVLPLSPGGIGLYEGAFTLLVVTLTPLGVPLALGAAIVDHAIKNVVTITGGVLSMLILNVSLTTAVEEGRDATLTEAD